MRDAFDGLDAGCREVMELVDAYALGALDHGEAGALQRHLSDCARCREELSVTSSELEQQRQIVAVLSASDTQKVAMEPASLRSEAESVYNWSQNNAAGFVVCRNFPALSRGRVYQVWLVTGDRAEPVATFLPQDGSCQIPMDMSRMNWHPEGIAISVEPQGGSRTQTRPWFSYAWL